MRVWRALGHLLVWLLVVGGLVCGALLILYAFASADVTSYSVTTGLFGLVLIGVTVAFGVAVRGWRRS